MPHEDTDRPIQENDSIIYHYCSADAFINILSEGRQKFWLSSLLASNDYLEGKLFANTVKAIVEAKNGSHPLDLDTLAKAIEENDRWLGLGMCFSKNGDLLSQWRGYASDGSGFSIGFSRAELQNAMKLQRFASLLVLDDVKYKTEDQLISSAESYAERYARVLSSIKEGKRGLDFLNDEQTIQVLSDALELLRQQYFWKQKGFIEEEEVRLLLTLNYGCKDYLINGQNRTPAELGIKFRASLGRIVPYFEFSFEKNADDLIKKVILGPKNPGSVRDVEFFLRENGYQKILASNGIRTSNISYR